MIEREFCGVQQSPENVLVDQGVFQLGGNQREEFLLLLFRRFAAQHSDEEFLQHRFGSELGLDQFFDFPSGCEPRIHRVADRQMQGLRDRRGGFGFAGANGASA